MVKIHLIHPWYCLSASLISSDTLPAIIKFTKLTLLGGPVVFNYLLTTCSWQILVSGGESSGIGYYDSANIYIRRVNNNIHVDDDPQHVPF
jgi:hypothetical protein